MLEIKLWLGPLTTLADVREFVSRTSESSGDYEAICYDENGEIEGLNAPVNANGA